MKKTVDSIVEFGLIFCGCVCFYFRLGSGMKGRCCTYVRARFLRFSESTTATRVLLREMYGDGMCCVILGLLVYGG